LLLDGQDELAALLREGWFTLVDRHDGHHAETDSAYAHWLRAQGYDSKDPWTEHVIAVENERGEILNGWKMRNARFPARMQGGAQRDRLHHRPGAALHRGPGREPLGAASFLREAALALHRAGALPRDVHGRAMPARQPHPAERGLARTPCLREWQNEEVAQSFQLDECIAAVRPTYQGLISQIDAHLGRVWEMLERTGRWKDTLVIFTADHGDYLGDHWLGEKELFHDCIQRVPFLLYDPSEADATRGTVDDRFVEAIDCVPTILDALGMEAQPHLLEGRSLLPLLRGESRNGAAPCSASSTGLSGPCAAGSACRPGNHRGFMVRTERWKYIHWTSGIRPQLYDLAADPEEFFDLGEDPALEDVRVMMRERLLDWATNLKTRTTLTWAEAEFRTDRHKAGGVFYGEW
jgi:arylsulfatase A-like enzyme